MLGEHNGKMTMEQRFEKIRDKVGRLGGSVALGQLNLLMERGLTHTQLAQLEDLGFFDAPASAGHHLAIPGGLFKHSVIVADTLMKLAALTSSETGVFWNDSIAGPIVVGWLHDLCKCQAYIRVPPVEGMRPKFVKNERVPYLGHGSASLAYVAQLGFAIAPDEASCILAHMGLFRDEEVYRKELDGPFAPHVILTHTADMIASQVIEKREDV